MRKVKIAVVSETSAAESDEIGHWHISKPIEMLIKLQIRYCISSVTYFHPAVKHIHRIQTAAVLQTRAAARIQPAKTII